MKHLLTILTLFLLCTCCQAQEILPTELFQIFKFWTMDIANFDKNTYDYIQTIDKQWELRIPPQRNENGVDLLMGYHDDKVWYKDNELKIILSYDKKLKGSKSVLYQFTDRNIWLRYNRQMEVMNATSLLSKSVQGGQQEVFEVSGITIYLTEFLPGINGVERSYQVIFADSQ